MKDILCTNHLTKVEINRLEKKRLELLQKALKRKTKKKAAYLFNKKIQNCSGSELNSDNSLASRAVNFNKKKLKNKSFVRPFLKKFNRYPYFNPKGGYNACPDYKCIEKLSTEQILSKE